MKGEPALSGASVVSVGKARPKRIPVAVVDQSDAFRKRVTSILPATRFRIVASCSNVSELSVKRVKKGCQVLITLDERAETVLQRLASLTEKQGLLVVMLSERFRPEEMLAAIRAGAHGYLLKHEISPNTLVTSLELVWTGGVVIPAECRKLLYQSGPSREPPETDAERGHDPGWLEQALLEQLTHGASTKHIARELNIAETTAKTHLRRIFLKLGVGSRTEAAMWAIQHWRNTAIPVMRIPVSRRGDTEDCD